MSDTLTQTWRMYIRWRTGKRETISTTDPVKSAESLNERAAVMAVVAYPLPVVWGPGYRIKGSYASPALLGSNLGSRGAGDREDPVGSAT